MDLQPNLDFKLALPFGPFRSSRHRPGHAETVRRFGRNDTAWSSSPGTLRLPPRGARPASGVLLLVAAAKKFSRLCLAGTATGNVMVDRD